MVERFTRFTRRDFIKLTIIGFSGLVMPWDKIIRSFADQNLEMPLGWNVGWWPNNPNTQLNNFSGVTPQTFQEALLIVPTPTALPTPYPKLTREEYFLMTTAQREAVKNAALKFNSDPVARKVALSLLPPGLEQSAFTLYSKYKPLDDGNIKEPNAQGSGSILERRPINSNLDMVTIITADHVVSENLTEPISDKVYRSYRLSGIYMQPPQLTPASPDYSASYQPLPILRFSDRDIAIVPFLIPNDVSFPFLPLMLNRLETGEPLRENSELFTYPSPFGISIPQIVKYNGIVAGSFDLRTQNTVALGASGALLADQFGKSRGIITDVPKPYTALASPLFRSDIRLINHHLASIQMSINQGT